MTTAAVAPAAPTPASPAPAQATRQKEPGAFARELGRAAQDTPEARRAENTRQNEKAERGKDKAPEKAADHPRSDEDRSTAVDETEGAKADEDDGDDKAPADLSALLAGLLNPAARAASARGALNRAAGAKGEAEAGAASAGAGRAQAAATKAEPAAALQTAAAEARTGGNPEAAGAERRSDFRAELAALAPQGAPAQTTPVAAAEARAAATATPYAGQIAAPVGSPDFAPGLSAQVSVMLRDGMQEARLQLNPAEMGPITVQIQVEGNTAQVVMSAQQADTRQALEQALPTLAGALQEAGLTLTGGGVFEQQQPSGREARGDAPAGGSRPAGVDGEAAAEVDAAPAARRSRGVVDFYA